MPVPHQIKQSWLLDTMIGTTNCDLATLSRMHDHVSVIEINLNNTTTCSVSRTHAS